jgi:serine/threonine-protein kinase RsbW
VSSVRLAATAASVGHLREILRDDLAVLPEPVREEVALVATELLGNSVRHARALDDGQLAVAWGVGEYGVEISVTDGGGATAPTARDAAPTETRGRGLSIVATLAAQWGVEQQGDVTTVWAVVPFAGSNAYRAARRS